MMVGMMRLSEVTHTQLHNEGRLEILASAFMGSEADGGNLWLYIQPDDFRSNFWPRKSLASGFSPNGYLPGNLGNKMSPGKHRVFFPNE